MLDRHKVPSEVDVSLGDVPDFKDPDPSFKDAYFLTVGRLTPQKINSARQCYNLDLDAKRSNQGAAETCTFIKLSLNSNHIMKSNEYNQVCILGVELFGTPLRVIPVPWLSVFDMLYVDPEINDLRGQILGRLSSAHENRRYVYAKKLDNAEEELKSGGEILAAMLSEGRLSLDQKHFGKAGILNTQIDDYRRNLIRRLNVETLLEKDGVNAENDLEEEPPKAEPEESHESKEIGINTTLTTLQMTSILSNLYGEKSDKETQKPEPSETTTESTPQDRPPSSKHEAIPEIARYDPPDEPSLPQKPHNEEKAPETPQPLNEVVEDAHLETNPLEEEIPEDSNTPEHVANQPRSRRNIPPKEVVKDAKLEIKKSDRKYLSFALSVYGEKTIAKSVNKYATVRTEGSEEVLKRFRELLKNPMPHSSTKVFKGTFQILMKFLRDLVIKIFRDGVFLMTLLYNDFVTRHSLPLNEVVLGTLEKPLEQLLLRCSDTTNNKIAVLSRTGIDNLLRTKVIHDSEEFQRIIFRRLDEGSSLPPRCDFMKTKMVGRYLEMQGQLPKRLVRMGTRFGLSAIENVENRVREQGKKIILKLFSSDPQWVEDYFSENVSMGSRKSIIVRSLLQEMQKRRAEQQQRKQ